MPKNIGLGIALREGLKKCQSKIILRFDNDDINHERLAEIIVEKLDKGEIDIFSSNIIEFEEDSKNYTYIKKCP